MLNIQRLSKDQITMFLSNQTGLAAAQASREIQRIEALLDLLLIPELQQSYRESKHATINNLYARYSGYITGKQFKASNTCGGIYYLVFMKASVDKLKYMRQELETYVIRILRDQCNWCSLDKIDRAPVKIHMPERSHHLEVTALQQITRKQVTNLEYDINVQRIFENFNWLYDQSSTRGYNKRSYAIIQKLLHNYQQALAKYKTDLHSAVDELITVAHQVASLVDGMLRNPSYYFVDISKAVANSTLRVYAG